MLGAGLVELEWTLAMTMSSWARVSSARSMLAVGEDVALDAGEDVEAAVELLR